jgi:hypothetical protein
MEIPEAVKTTIATIILHGKETNTNHHMVVNSNHGINTQIQHHTEPTKPHHLSQAEPPHHHNEEAHVKTRTATKEKQTREEAQAPNGKPQEKSLMMTTLET